MKLFDIFVAVLLLISANTHAEVREFRIDENRTLIVDCSNERIFNIVRNGEVVFSMTESKIEDNTAEKCLNDVDFGKYYDGYRGKVITVLFEMFGNISPKIIYTVNLKENRIELVGSIYKVDKNYSVIVDCNKGRKFHLVHDGQVVSSTIDYDENSIDYINLRDRDVDNVVNKYCVMVGFGNDFDGHGKNVLTISPEVGAPIASVIKVYVIDFKKNVIKYAGDLPSVANLLKDGSFLYETLDIPDSRSRTVLAFLDDKIIDKRKTTLFYDGNICVNARGVVQSDCKDGVVATAEKPVCVEHVYKKPGKIIPLEKCDIKNDKNFSELFRGYIDAINEAKRENE
jgi:hypothetical protein